MQQDSIDSGGSNDRQLRRPTKSSRKPSCDRWFDRGAEFAARQQAIGRQPDVVRRPGGAADARPRGTRDRRPHPPNGQKQQAMYALKTEAPIGA